METVAFVVWLVVCSFFWSRWRIRHARTEIKMDLRSESSIRATFAESMLVGHFLIIVSGFAAIIAPIFVLGVICLTAVLVGAYAGYRYLWHKYIVGAK